MSLQNYLGLVTDASTRIGGRLNFTLHVHKNDIIVRNSETIAYFWKTWNIPVHRWCSR